MPTPQDTYLPSYEELTVPELTVSFPVLKAASTYMGKYCDNSCKEFMLCRNESLGDIRRCVNEGKEVTRCGLDFLHKVKNNCAEVFEVYWKCIDNSPVNQLKMCRRYQAVLDECIESKIGVKRPELGYFTRVRVHETDRPKPARTEFYPEAPEPKKPSEIDGNTQPKHKYHTRRLMDFL